MGRDTPWSRGRDCTAQWADQLGIPRWDSLCGQFRLGRNTRTDLRRMHVRFLKASQRTRGRPCSSWFGERCAWQVSTLSTCAARPSVLRAISVRLESVRPPSPLRLEPSRGAALEAISCRPAAMGSRWTEGVTRRCGQRSAKEGRESHQCSGLAVAPDHVYVMPPNVTLTLQDDQLHLTPRGNAPVRHMPADALFNRPSNLRMVTLETARNEPGCGSSIRI
jgi:hypothetical protein